jgi:hypothetical protein
MEYFTELFKGRGDVAAVAIFAIGAIVTVIGFFLKREKAAGGGDRAASPGKAESGNGYDHPARKGDALLREIHEGVNELRVQVARIEARQENQESGMKELFGRVNTNSESIAYLRGMSTKRPGDTRS